jgi:hypothetical protein
MAPELADARLETAIWQRPEPDDPGLPIHGRRKMCVWLKSFASSCAPKRVWSRPRVTTMPPPHALNHPRASFS